MEGQLVDPSAPQTAEPGQGGYGHRAAQGFASTIASSLIVKAVLFGGQMVIGWFLTQSELGLAATAIAASIFPGLIKDFGIQPLLQRHPRRYSIWSPDAMWMANVLALLAGLLTLTVAPLVSRITHAPVTGLMVVLAIATFLSGPAVVPFVKVAIDLRFVLAARLNTAFAISSTLVSVVMAMTGFGPYAVVIPPLFNALLRLLVGIWLVPIQWQSRPDWTRCWVMLIDGWKMMLSLFFFQIVWQCDYLILGLLHTQKQVGIYYLAFQLSTQALTLLSQNLGGVLLPVLGHLSGEWTRQTEGFVRALRYLCALGIPLCFAQAAVAEPLLRLIWHDKWVEAIPALEALSIGSAFRLLSFPTASLLMAQGRMGTYLASAICSSIGFLLIVTVAARLGGATSVAIAVAGFYVVAEVIVAAVALGAANPNDKSMLRGLHTISRIISTPLLASIAGGGLGYLASTYTLRHMGPLSATLTGGLVALLASGFALFVISPKLLHGIIIAFRAVMFRHISAPTAGPGD